MTTTALWVSDVRKNGRFDEWIANVNADGWFDQLALICCILDRVELNREQAFKFLKLTPFVSGPSALHTAQDRYKKLDRLMNPKPGYYDVWERARESNAAREAERQRWITEHTTPPLHVPASAGPVFPKLTKQEYRIARDKSVAEAEAQLRARGTVTAPSPVHPTLYEWLHPTKPPPNVEVETLARR